MEVKKKERLLYIDVLRVIAMMTVLICHYTRSLEYAGITYLAYILPNEIFNVYLGSFGVAVFFVLSGVSLMYTYSGKMDIKKYFKKRFLGIFPMYWTAWLLAFLYFFWKMGQFRTEVPYWKIILTVFGMDGYANWYGANFYLLGEWFLGCLLLLYLLFPILKWGVEKHPIITAVVIIAIYAIGPFVYHGTIPSGNYFLFRIPEFAFGMYFIHYGGKVKLPVALVSGGILAFAAFADLSTVDVLYKNTVVGIASFLFVTWICTFIKWDFFYKICGIIGKYAYAVFLTHHVISNEIVFHFAGRIFTRLETYIFFILYLIVVGIASKMLYKLNDWVLGLFKKEV